MLAGVLIAISLMLLGWTIYYLATTWTDRWIRELKKERGAARGKLYEKLYGLPWRNVTANNYGFAPAETKGPEQFQLQMYRELYKLLEDDCGTDFTSATLLEVSCGRGGGLVSLLELWPQRKTAIGLDYSENALKFCKTNHGHIPHLWFVKGSALELPFASESFDVLLNVEASHNYGNDVAFFHEVNRVLRPGGVFLYADYRRHQLIPELQQQMGESGLRGSLHNITSNVAEACRLDSPRRRKLLQESLPWYYRLLLNQRLANYGALEGSRKFQAFQNNERFYFLTCAVKVR
jgi:ubiquinone/menaquinone biosynthesis C-methylase UbiE